MVMFVSSAMFLTSPTDAPSGVSDGHTTPHCVGCSLRGCTSLPVFSMGVLMRRRCESVATYVMRLSTCRRGARPHRPPLSEMVVYTMT